MASSQALSRSRRMNDLRIEADREASGSPSALKTYHNPNPPHSTSAFPSAPPFSPNICPKAAQILGTSDQRPRERATGLPVQEAPLRDVTNISRLPEDRHPEPASSIITNTESQTLAYPSGSYIPVPSKAYVRTLRPQSFAPKWGITDCIESPWGSRPLRRQDTLDEIEALLEDSSQGDSSASAQQPDVKVNPQSPETSYRRQDLAEAPSTRIRLQKMPKATPPPLPLGSKTETKSQAPLSPALSPKIPRSPRSPPASPGQNSSARAAMSQKNLKSELPSSQKASRPVETEDASSDLPQTSPITAIPQYPLSPTTNTSKHGRDASKSFFSNLKASRSNQRLNNLETGTKASSKTDLNSRASSKDRNIYSSSRDHDSTPELQNFTSPERSNGTATEADEGSENPQGIEGDPQALTENEPPLPMSSKKSKSKFGLLSRSRSIRLDDPTRSLRPAPKHRNIGGSDSEDQISNSEFQEPMKTAPLQPDRERTFWGSVNRNRSADRQLQYPQDDGIMKSKKDKVPAAPASLSSSANSPWSVSAAFKQAGSKAADGLGKTGKGLLNKMVRSGSSTEKEILVEVPHTLTVINLPLVEQTRRTRISKKLELSKDKTEFWMPALPWRCIDYLNANGCEEEGLYRVPGSGKDVKLWQKRFDTEYDINLFDQPDLYDINTIGSLFKQWLRELPDEILPKEAQARISEQSDGATSTPQVMKDELSRLPPFNYYLLFAITCHLSLLLSYKDVNRMDYRNLCICFQPCMKIDHYCFTFLVCDWKNCWQGCWTEKDYLDEEYRVEKEPKRSFRPNGAQANTHPNGSTVDERAISSSESNQPTALESTPTAAAAALPKLKPAEATNGGNIKEHSQEPNLGTQRKDSQRLSLGLPPLSPIRVE